MPATPASAATVLSGTVAADYATMTGAVIARVGDWQLAEEALQDAMVRAIESWDVEGIPRNPAGWLVTVARRRAIDLTRRADARVRTAGHYAVAIERGLHEVDDEPESDLGDERLRLICTCAHPALSLESRVALTLRTVLGFTPPEIGRLMFTSDAAVEKRLVRARAKIAHAGIPYRVPPAAELPDRVDGVLGVVYVLFTTGYNSAPQDREQARERAMLEAIRLARLLVALLPDEDAAETRGLLALMLVQHSRTAARTASDGTPLTMEQQDRSLWNHVEIAEAASLLRRRLSRAAHTRQPVGRYTLQAAIALEHALPPTAQSTDWRRLERLHSLLARVSPSPTQLIARAIVVGRADGGRAGLEVLEHGAATYPGLDSSFAFHAARADLLERAGDVEQAAQELRRSVALAASEGERRALRAKLTQLER